jgi:protein involved in polysaccharide export with SLBB domain
MRRKSFLWQAVLLIGLAVAGCRTDFGPVVIEPDPIAPSAVASHLHPGERIKLTVYGEPNLSGFYDISPSGTLSLPLAGTMRAAGRTRAEIEREITRRYSEKLQEPQVTVEVVEFRPFYIMGEVTNPGQFPYRSGLNVLTATSTAGGLTYRASRTTVLIQHAGEEVWREYPLTAAVLISPGDLIRVPERYF